MSVGTKATATKAAARDLTGDKKMSLNLKMNENDNAVQNYSILSLGPEIVVVEEVVVTLWEAFIVWVFINLVTKHETNVHISS